MNDSALRVAVVGHTNTGKTSLVRTLTRDRGFGEVRGRGGTTRQVASVVLRVGDRDRIELFDSPGLENAPELIEWLERAGGERHRGPERIRCLLNDDQARRRFDHEARVLELMLAVDVALYVVDAREPVLEKYQDELAILGQCACPVIAVLNFVASEASREAQWRRALAGVGLLTVLAFDAVVREPATEKRLFEKLRGQLDGFEPAIDAWLARLADEEEHRLLAGARAVAELLVDAAACRRECPPESVKEGLETLQDAVRRREQACVDTLLDLYRFAAEDYAGEMLSLTDGRWREDVFDPQTLAHYGIRTSQATGAGAGAGALVDIGTGGLSLGLGTAVGAAAGASAGLVRTFGGDLLARARGRVRLGVDEAALRLLAWRQLELLAALIRRGHASTQPFAPPEGSRWKARKLPSALRRARHQPDWSSLGDSRAGGGRARAEAVDELAGILVEEVRGGAESFRDGPA